MTRKRLPTTRDSVTHRVQITDERGGQYDLYIIVGTYPLSGRSRKQGKKPRPAELFLKMGKVGSMARGTLDIIGIQTSLLLQTGFDLATLCDKMKGTGFEPSGPTDNPNIPFCTSIIDYVFRWVEYTFADVPQ